MPRPLEHISTKQLRELIRKAKEHGTIQPNGYLRYFTVANLRAELALREDKESTKFIQGENKEKRRAVAQAKKNNRKGRCDRG